MQAVEDIVKSYLLLLLLKHNRPEKDAVVRSLVLPAGRYGMGYVGAGVETGLRPRDRLCGVPLSEYIINNVFTTISEIVILNSPALRYNSSVFGSWNVSTRTGTVLNNTVMMDMYLGLRIEHHPHSSSSTSHTYDRSNHTRTWLTNTVMGPVGPWPAFGRPLSVRRALAMETPIANSAKTPALPSARQHRDGCRASPGRFILQAPNSSSHRTGSLSQPGASVVPYKRPREDRAMIPLLLVTLSSTVSWLAASFASVAVSFAILPKRSLPRTTLSLLLVPRHWVSGF